jgi:hypothetical protein
VWGVCGVVRLGVIIDGSLGVDYHRLRVVASHLHILILAIVGMPRRSQRAKFLSTGVLEALQLQLIIFAAARATLVRTPGAPLVPSTLGKATLAEAAARLAVRCCEAERRHDLAKERTKGSAGSGRDTKCGLRAGPEGDIGGRVEEVFFVRKCVYIRDASNSRDRCPEVHCQLPCVTRECRCILQCADRENHDDGKLLSASHLQVPDEENRKGRESPVTHASDSGVAVENRNNDRRVHTGAFAAGVLFPEVFTWQALKQENEEEHSAVKFRGGENGPYDRLVDLVDAEAQQHDANAGFDEHVADQVERLAEPPELDTVRHQCLDHHIDGELTSNA